MSRFFFNIRNGIGYVPDEEGAELSDENEARKVAVTGARSLMSAEVLEGALNLRGRIEVTDEQHELVMTVEFREALEIEGP